MKEYQIDYKWEEDPMLVLPMSVGAMLLSGELFGWLNTLDPYGMPADQMTALKIVYFGFLLCCSCLAAWRLMRTVHVTVAGLEYRFLGRTQEVIPWDRFSCATIGSARQMKRNLVFLIPKAFAPLPDDRQEKYSFLTHHYRELIHFHATKSNIRSIGTYLGGLGEDMYDLKVTN